jgi:hypothetical protein
MMLDTVRRQRLNNRLPRRRVSGRFPLCVPETRPLNVPSGDSRGNEPVVTGPTGGRGSRLKLDLDAVLQIQPWVSVGSGLDERRTVLQGQPALPGFPLFMIPTPEHGVLFRIAPNAPWRAFFEHDLQVDAIDRSDSKQRCRVDAPRFRQRVIIVHNFNPITLARLKCGSRPKWASVAVVVLIPLVSVSTGKVTDPFSRDHLKVWPANWAHK